METILKGCRAFLLDKEGGYAELHIQQAHVVVDISLLRKNMNRACASGHFFGALRRLHRPSFCRITKQPPLNGKQGCEPFLSTDDLLDKSAPRAEYCLETYRAILSTVLLESLEKFVRCHSRALETQGSGGTKKVVSVALQLYRCLLDLMPRCLIHRLEEAYLFMAKYLIHFLRIVCEHAFTFDRKLHQPLPQELTTSLGGYADMVSKLPRKHTHGTRGPCLTDDLDKYHEFWYAFKDTEVSLKDYRGRLYDLLTAVLLSKQPGWFS